MKCVPVLHFKNWKFPYFFSFLTEIFFKKEQKFLQISFTNFDAAVLIQQPLMEENLYFTMNIKKLHIKRTNTLIKLMDNEP